MTFEEYKKKYDIKLNEQQEKAVRSVNGYVLLLAVPGSGKTTVLVARLGYMICVCGIAPENILTMTYTVSAANDMKKRFISKFGDEYSDRITFKTINAVCFSVIRYYSKIRGSTAFELMDDSDRSTLLSRLFREINGEWPTDLQKKNLSSDITYIKNMMLKPEEILQLKTEGYSNLPMLFNRYNEELKKMRKMDFDDQLAYTYSIFTKYPEILNKYRSQYRYICVDEAQDTSKIQHEIIRLLAIGYTDGYRGNYFAVGDEDQSIYGFRAAYPEALYNFENTYPDAQVLLMEKNYRSTKAIVSAADMFIKKNLNRHPKSMTADSDDEGEPIKFIQLKNRTKQYKQLVSIAKNCKVETAVLFRDNDSSIPIIDKLSRAEIGYRARGLDSLFFSNPVVLDIAGIMQFTFDGCRDRSFFEKNYYKLGLYMRKNQAEYILKSCPKGQNIIKFIAGNTLLPRNIRENAVSSLANYDIINYSPGGADTALSAIVYGLDYESYLEKFNKSDSAITILSEIAKEEPTSKRFILRLNELKEIILKGGTDTTSKFILSTVHSSKGLEYDKVIIIDAYDGSFPKADKFEQRDEYEEERRLFYVAMTRARKMLVLYSYTYENCSFQDEIAADIPKESKTTDFSKNVSTTVKGKAADVPKLVRLGPAEEMLEDRLYPGTMLDHTMFGKGNVLERTSDTKVLIAFDKGFNKDLLVQILLRNRLVSYIDEKKTDSCYDDI